MAAMDLARLEALRRRHPGWRLLAADSAPFVVSFLHATFLAPNVRTLPEQTLLLALEDALHAARARSGAGAFPRSAGQYLETWADEDHAWLRKYYPPNVDEPWFDITPETEKALTWLAELETKSFVGTESRLLMVFELLRQMTRGTELDATKRIADLERRRADIDAEISDLRAGNITLMEATQVRDRFQQMASTARALLSDFRQVEQNFRDLDRELREKIAIWEGSKGALLDDIFGERDAIRDSDEGASFRAFWDLLMSPERQDELAELLAKVFELPAVRELRPDRRLLRIHHDWLEAGSITQRTVARVSSQLRRYLDDQAWLENRRIMQIVRRIEQHALALREADTTSFSAPLDETAPDVELPFERALFRPTHKPRVDARIEEATGTLVPSDALFAQSHVDREALRARVVRLLGEAPQVTLAEVAEAYPLEHGLAELVGYLALASDDEKAAITPEREQAIAWTDTSGRRRVATVPLVVFTR